MDKLKTLELKKLLKELDYIESNFEYMSEVVSEADMKFIKYVNDFLILHPDLKEIYDKKISDRIDRSIKNDENRDVNNTDENVEDDDVDEIPEENINEEEKSIENISPKLKKLYREIVKLTHPDKVKNQKLNELYIRSTDYYNLNDKIGIYKICSELDIEYEIEIDDDIFISTKIDSLKKRIVFLESTFTWRWHQTENEEEKNQILINYIKIRIQ